MVGDLSDPSTKWHKLCYLHSMTSDHLEPNTERVPFMAPASLVATLDAAAKHRGISRSELIRRTLERDDHIGRDSRRWQSRNADVVEQRADTQPRPQKWQGSTIVSEHDGDGELVPVVGAAYGPEPRVPFAFAGHAFQAGFVDETTEITPELAEAISGASTKMSDEAHRQFVERTLTASNADELPADEVEKHPPLLRAALDRRAGLIRF